MDTAVTRPGAKRSPFSSLITLVLATTGLVAFILGLGDVRRQRYAVEQARRHADAYQRRVGDGGMLPLNLAPEAPIEGAEALIPLEWPDHETAAKLRERTGRFIVAQTVPINQSIQSDGRAVIFFLDGRFDAEWMNLDAFEAARAAPSSPSK